MPHDIDYDGLDGHVEVVHPIVGDVRGISVTHSYKNITSHNY